VADIRTPLAKCNNTNALIKEGEIFVKVKAIKKPQSSIRNADKHIIL
jgi:hypothetical protein